MRIRFFPLCLFVGGTEILEPENARLPAVDGGRDRRASLPAHSVPAPFPAVGIPQQHHEFAGIAASLEGQRQTVEFPVRRDGGKRLSPQHRRPRTDTVHSAQTDLESGTLRIHPFDHFRISIASETPDSGGKELIRFRKEQNRTQKQPDKSNRSHTHSFLSFP